MTRHEIITEYFEWLCELVCKGHFSEAIPYRDLLMQLHDIDFTFSIPKDKNRAEDGLDLRYRFAREFAYEVPPDCLWGPCSVLEMMVALAVRCEQTIMDEPDYGDRTGQWFWGMITNLGLGSAVNGRYDRKYIREVIQRFLDREYEPDGKGGLFRVRHCDRDLTKVEIWIQMCWYLDSIT